MVVLEGSATLYDNPNAQLISFVTNGHSVGLTVVGEDAEVLFVVDMNRKAVRERKFYLTHDGGGDCTVQVYNEVQGEILGEVVMVKVEWEESMGGTKTGFSEETEYF
jgi:hypothetical protein